MGATIYAIGQNNFHFDRSQAPNMRGEEPAALMGAATSALVVKARVAFFRPHSPNKVPCCSSTGFLHPQAVAGFHGTGHHHEGVTPGGMTGKAKAIILFRNRGNAVKSLSGMKMVVKHRLELCEQILHALGTIPDLESTDEIEVILAKWLRSCSQEGSKTFDPDVKAWLCGNRRHVALAEFIKQRGRLPQPTSSDPEEQSLAFWKNQMFYNPKRNQTTGGRLWLRDAYKHLLADHQPWQVRFAEVQAFYEKHGHTPALRAKDPEVRRLGIWLNNARNRPSEFIEEVRAWYEAHRHR